MFKPILAVSLITLVGACSEPVTVAAMEEEKEPTMSAAEPTEQPLPRARVIRKEMTMSGDKGNGLAFDSGGVGNGIVAAGDSEGNGFIGDGAAGNGFASGGGDVVGNGREGHDNGNGIIAASSGAGNGFIAAANSLMGREAKGLSLIHI